MQQYNTPELYHILLKGMLKMVHNKLISHKIEYWIDGGTLLGAIRHKDIIPHDDDIDIGVNYVDYNVKIKNLIPEFEKMKIQVNEITYDLKVVESPGIIKIYIEGMWSQTDFKIVATPTLDIFSWDVKKDKIQLSSIAQRKQFVNCFYLRSEMYPLKLYPFGEFEFYGANKPIGYLNRYYGSDCLDVAKIEIREPSSTNLLNKAVKKIEFKLS